MENLYSLSTMQAKEGSSGAPAKKKTFSIQSFASDTRPTTPQIKEPSLRLSLRKQGTLPEKKPRPFKWNCKKPKTAYGNGASIKPKPIQKSPPSPNCIKKDSLLKKSQKRLNLQNPKWKAGSKKVVIVD